MTDLWSQSTVVGLWVVGVVILVNIKVISVFLTKGHCHVLVMVRMICWYTTWGYNDFTTICSLQEIQHQASTPVCTVDRESTNKHAVDAYNAV